MISAYIQTGRNLGMEGRIGGEQESWEEGGITALEEGEGEAEAGKGERKKRVKLFLTA